MRFGSFELNSTLPINSLHVPFTRNIKTEKILKKLNFIIY